MKKLMLIVTIALLAGCAAKFQNQVDFNPQEPLRVAVLPFVQVDDQGNFENSESRLIIDNLALLSDKLEQTPAQIVRKQTLAALKATSLDVLSPVLIDIDLPHYGFAKAGGGLDLVKLYSTKPDQLCTKFLNCDAVLYGKVFKWDRSYYAIQSVNSIGVELTMVSARNGKVLFSAKGEDSESRGITKGPTGFSDLVIEPVKGLDSEIIVELAARTVEKMIEPLDARKRPEFLTAEPPSIFAASHDKPAGSLVRGSELVVVMMGSPRQQASFSIGNTIQSVPMFERSPGHYYGEYVPLPEDNFAPQNVVVSLRDQYGRTTERKISLPPVGLS